MPAVRLEQPADIPDSDLTEWGPAGEPLSDPVSTTRGRLIHRNPDGANETGVWVCTPGRWRCAVDRAEFCQFLAGHCVYLADSGERLEIRGGDAAYFPAGWTGTCEVLDTVRKTYMIC